MFRGSTKTSPANMKKFKSELRGFLWHVWAAVLVQEAVIPNLSCTCLLESVEWACPQNTDHSTNSRLFMAALAAASFQPVSPQEPGQRWARWARAAVRGAAGMRARLQCGVAGRDNSLFLCLRGAGTAGSLLLCCCTCSLVLLTCAPAHPLERGWVVPGWPRWDSCGSREPGVAKVAMGKGWAGSGSASAPEFDSLKGTLVTSCCKRISCSNRHCHVRKSEWKSFKYFFFHEFIIYNN